jgi:transcriptional regulator with PAS, ATPase and Fis domain
MSARRDRPFVEVNCGAIPRELFEREMFGHVRGAFTGASEPAPGLFEAANGGTLFLDEIGELPLELQPKLLRVLEERSIRRLGATQQIATDVRIVAASNRVLRELVREKSFREDLYYRMCVLEHEILPLRERRRELPAIIGHLLRQNLGEPEITAEALERLCAYPWPGNIRELNNALLHALVRSGGAPIDVHHLPDRVCVPGFDRAEARAAEELPRVRYAAPDDEMEEREVILRALEAEGSNRTRTAERLGMSRSTLWAKLRYHRLV